MVEFFRPLGTGTLNIPVFNPKWAGYISSLTVSEEEEMKKELQVEYKSIEEIVDMMRLAIANEEISLTGALETMFKFGKQLGAMAPRPAPEQPAPEAFVAAYDVS